VVAGDNEDGDTRVGYLDERCHHAFDQCVRHPASIEEVTSVDNGIRALGTRNLQGAMKGREEVRSPVRTCGPRPQRLVEAEMGIGQEQDVDASTHCTSSFPRDAGHGRWPAGSMNISQFLDGKARECQLKCDESH